MFKSEYEAYLKPSSFKSKSYILGIGNGFRLIDLLSSLKSEMKPIVPLFLRIKNVGASYSELFLRFETPTLTNLLISIFRVTSCTFGIGNGFACYP